MHVEIESGGIGLDHVALQMQHLRTDLARQVTRPLGGELSRHSLPFRRHRDRERPVGVATRE